MDYCWWTANNNRLYPNILPLSYCEGWRLLITSYLKYLFIMELRFDVILYCKLGNENSEAGHIKCLRGRRFPTPALI